MKDNISSIGCFARADIAAYVDGELHAGLARALDRHVEGCEKCRRTLAEQRRFLASLSAALGGFTIDLPPGFAKKIASRARNSVSINHKFFTLLRGDAF